MDQQLSGQQMIKTNKTKIKRVQSRIIEFMIGKAERTLNTQRDKEYHTQEKNEMNKAQQPKTPLFTKKHTHREDEQPGDQTCCHHHRGCVEREFSHRRGSRKRHYVRYFCQDKTNKTKQKNFFIP